MPRDLASVTKAGWTVKAKPSDLASVSPAGRMVKAAPPDLAPVVETGRHHICAHADHGMLPDTDAPAADGGAHIGSGVPAADASSSIPWN